MAALIGCYSKSSRFISEFALKLLFDFREFSRHDLVDDYPFVHMTYIDQMERFEGKCETNRYWSHWLWNDQRNLSEKSHERLSEYASRSVRGATSGAFAGESRRVRCPRACSVDELMRDPEVVVYKPAAS